MYYYNMNKNTYKDPKRKIGSQSETPTIMIKDETIIIGGYQQFKINLKTRNIEYIGKPYKFGYINEIMKNLYGKYNCRSIVDIGCSSGLTSLIAFNNGFKYIVSLDHDPEYIETLCEIKNKCNITEIKEHVYSFGNTIHETFDVVFCGALIHWIFSLTADFRGFDSIVSYLISLTNTFLIIEWIHPNDGAIRCLTISK